MTVQTQRQSAAAARPAFAYEAPDSLRTFSSASVLGHDAVAREAEFARCEKRASELLERSARTERFADRIMAEIGEGQAALFEDVALLCDAADSVRQLQPGLAPEGIASAVRAGTAGKLATAAQQRVDAFAKVYSARVGRLDQLHRQMQTVQAELRAASWKLATLGMTGDTARHHEISERSVDCAAEADFLQGWLRRFEPSARARNA